MSTATFTIAPRRELARRVNAGLEITLYWNVRDNTTTIEVHHTDTAETIAFPVPADQALDAFYHPFAHLPEQQAA
jgi:hypothetical protein